MLRDYVEVDVFTDGPFRGNPLETTKPSPAVGEHTDEVLREIGFQR